MERKQWMTTVSFVLDLMTNVAERAPMRFGIEAMPLPAGETVQFVKDGTDVSKTFVKKWLATFVNGEPVLNIAPSMSRADALLPGEASGGVKRAARLPREKPAAWAAGLRSQKSSMDVTFSLVAREAITAISSFLSRTRMTKPSAS